MNATRGQGTGSPDRSDWPHRHRPPRDCPVCGSVLEVTELGCPGCGSRLSGSFEGCRFCALSDADADLVEAFLRSRGNMRDLERHLGVSYPTARQRFAEVLGRLGLADGEGLDDRGDQAGTDEPAAPDGSGATGSTAAQGDPGSPTRAAIRAQVLERLAAGDLTAAQAAVLLRG